MKFFLLIDGKEAGPFEPEQIREMLGAGKITFVTLAMPENHSVDWLPIDNFPKVIGSATPPESPTTNQNTEGKPSPHQVEKILFAESSVEFSGVASTLSTIAILELILSPIAGLIVGGSNGGNAITGFEIFICGFTGGLILLGFARVIEHSYESAQRLRQIERLLLKANADKKSI